RGGDFFKDLVSQYDATYNTQEDFGEVQLYPQYSTIFSSASKGWTKMTVTSSDLETRTENSRTSVTAGLSCSYGLWWAGGGYSSDEERKYSRSEATNVTINMEVLRVSIRYPWMEFDVFGSRNWRWGRGSLYYPNGVISDGVYNPDNNSKEIMPFVPTSMIIAR